MDTCCVICTHGMTITSVLTRCPSPETSFFPVIYKTLLVNAVFFDTMRYIALCLAFNLLLCPCLLILVFVFLQENLGNCNAFEFSMVMVGEGVTIRLPYHVFSSTEKRRPVLRCYDLEMSLRSTDEYLDVAITSSPMTMTVPISDTLERPQDHLLFSQPESINSIEQQTYLRISGSSLEQCDMVIGMYTLC